MQSLSKMPDDYMLGLKNRLETNMPLSELDRAVLVTLLTKKTVGRPHGSDIKTLQHIKIYLEYREKYVPSASEAVFEELKVKYGYKNISSVKKAVEKTKDMISSMKSAINADDDMLALAMAIVYSPYQFLKQGEQPKNILDDIFSWHNDGGK